MHENALLAEKGAVIFARDGDGLINVVLILQDVMSMLLISVKLAGTCLGVDQFHYGLF